MRRLLLSVSLTLGLISAARAGGTIAWPAPEPDPAVNKCITAPSPIDAWLRDFHHTMVEARKKGPVDVIFDGDQRALGKNGSGAGGTAFPNLRAIDFGGANDPTQTILWRVQQGQADGLNPRVIVLQAGARNIGNNTQEQIAEGVKAIIAEYSKRFPDAVIVLTAIFPRGDKSAEASRPKIKAANDLLAPLADGSKVVYVDITDKLAAPDGSIAKEVMSDGVHLSAKGQQILVEALQPVFAAHLSSASNSAPATATAAASELPAPQGGTIVWPISSGSTGSPGANSAAIASPPMSWIPSFQQNLDDAHKLKQVDLIFDGDSITAGWKSSAGGAGIWRKYARLNGIDFGQPGHVTQSILWRLNNGQVDGLKPRLIVLLIGTNNLGSGPAEQIAEGIKAVIAEYQKRCPEAVILLQGIFPRGEAANNPARAKIKAINQIISTYGDGKKVIYLDFGDKLLQPDGTLSREIMPDFLHPGPKGYQIWSDAIKPVINQFFPSTAGEGPEAPTLLPRD